jgi:hypothetical protein
MNPSEETRPIQATTADSADEAFAPVREKRRRRPKGSRLLRRIRKRLGLRVKLGNLLIMVAAVIVVAGVAAATLVTDANNRVQSSLVSLNRVLASFYDRPSTELTLTDFERLRSNVDDLVRTLTSARRQLFFLQPVASLNPDVETTLTTLDAAESLSLAARDMLTGLEPTLFFLVSGERDEAVVAQISSGERIVELLRIGRSQFLSAEDHLNAAEARLRAISFSGISPRLLLDVQTLAHYSAQLVGINEVLQQAPELLTAALGLSGERSYLILSQNSDELRPSGGYISTYGWMSVRNGRITDYSYSPTTATSPNPPADEFGSEIRVPDWWIGYNQPIYAAWDGSWYADFPSTARMAMRYYDEGHNPQSPVSGVIAIDTVGFETILSALGSVAVPGYDQVVTPENFRQVVYDIRAFGDGETPHKRFIAALYQQIFTDWQETSYDPQKSTLLLGALLQSLQEKHVIIYMGDEALNQAIGLLGWSGAQTPASGEDYLMVADANLGNKSNRSIVRQLIYDVTIQEDGSAQSRTTVAYDYSARRASADPAVNPEYHGPLDYDNLMQLFVPPESSLVAAENLPYDPQVVTGDGLIIFVSQVTVPYDTGERFQFSYNTGPVTTQIGDYSRYRLLIQKQPGTLADAVSVQITLPAEAAVISVSPEPSASYSLDQPILEFQFSLASDQNIEVIYSADG